jgi:hypothetical protein
MVLTSCPLKLRLLGLSLPIEEKLPVKMDIIISNSCRVFHQLIAKVEASSTCKEPRALRSFLEVVMLLSRYREEANLEVEEREKVSLMELIKHWR